MRPSKFLSASGLSPRGGGSGTPHPPTPPTSRAGQAGTHPPPGIACPHTCDVSWN